MDQPPIRMFLAFSDQGRINRCNLLQPNLIAHVHQNRGGIGEALFTEKWKSIAYIAHCLTNYSKCNRKVACTRLTFKNTPVTRWAFVDCKLPKAHVPKCLR